MNPGQDVLDLDRPVDWDRGDRVVVTTTDYLPGHSEEFEIVEKLDPKEIRVRRIDPVTNSAPDRLSEGPSVRKSCKVRNSILTQRRALPI